MTIPETTLIYVGIPAAIYAVIVGVAALTSEKKRRVAAYRSDEKWPREPLLWTAADEVVASGSHGHGHGGPVEIGGSAHGRY